MKRLVAVPCLVLGLTLGVAMLPGSAYAAPTDSPTGYVGGWNMLHDPTMLPGAGGAMDHDNANGNAGMCRAVLESSGISC